MAPYLIHGIGSFPGSWFWDGFAYMAAGESLWLHPRRESAAGLELFYQFGHKFAQARYTSSSVIALMKGIYPLGGDAQAATGYFLFLCLFTFSSSCYFLAKVTMPGRRHLQVAFVALAAVSGPILNLVWANNFDHLLAMSIAPAILGLAYIAALGFDWRCHSVRSVRRRRSLHLPGDGGAVRDACWPHSPGATFPREKTQRATSERHHCCHHRRGACRSWVARPVRLLPESDQCSCRRDIRSGTTRQRILSNILLWRLRSGGMVRYVSAVCSMRAVVWLTTRNSPSASGAGPFSPQRYYPGAGMLPWSSPPASLWRGRPFS